MLAPLLGAREYWPPSIVISAAESMRQHAIEVGRRLDRFQVRDRRGRRAARRPGEEITYLCLEMQEEIRGCCSAYQDLLASVLMRRADDAEFIVDSIHRTGSFSFGMLNSRYRSYSPGAAQPIGELAEPSNDHRVTPGSYSTLSRREPNLHRAQPGPCGRPSKSA